jgi:hypothetical protein
MIYRSHYFGLYTENKDASSDREGNLTLDNISSRSWGTVLASVKGRVNVTNPPANKKNLETIYPSNLSTGEKSVLPNQNLK